MQSEFESLEFEARPLSWVTRSDDTFYKIVRRSDSLEDDRRDPSGISEAETEFELMSYLSARESGVPRPLRVDGACIEYPVLSGPDMIDVLKTSGDQGQAQNCIKSAMELLARLHGVDTGTTDFRRHDYELDPYCPVDAETAVAMQDVAPAIVIAGFEVRNFRFDEASGTWCFFDPHEIKIGVPEEDFARFVVSLLMLNWGRNVTCSIWDNFDLDALLSDYEQAGSKRLNKQVLTYCFRLVLQMRQHHASKSILGMAVIKRQVANLYMTIYFCQMYKWMRKHDYAI